MNDDLSLPPASAPVEGAPGSPSAKDAFSAQPMARPWGPATENEPPATSIEPTRSLIGRAADPASGPLTRFLALGLMFALVMLLVFIAPYVKAHWRAIDAQTEADALYVLRRAEHRAEAEVLLERRREELKEEARHADARLAFLDRKVDLISLGFREVARKVAPLVVSVQNLRTPKAADLGPFAKRTLVYDPEKDQKFVQVGVGAGVIVEPGVILTNNHVVKDAQRLRITFASGNGLGLDMHCVVADMVTDLAVLRIPENHVEALKADTHHTAPFADSDKDVQVGDWTLAVGSPRGLSQTLTQGVVSAKGRLLSLLDMVELLQTDAAINPGNSGGPLFDQHGKVMGINVAIAVDNGVHQGIGFAIPSNVARKICAQLTTLGEVPRGYLGIALDDLTGAKAKAMDGDGGGVLVVKVVPGEAAERAGVRAGDVILRFNREKLLKAMPMRHLRQLIADAAPGSAAEIEVWRDGERRTLRATVGKRPADLP